MEVVKEFFLNLWHNKAVLPDPQIDLAVRTLMRLCVAALFSGIIGYERQHSHRPAGLRTHVLVAVGSALVMCTSAYIKIAYPETTADPARLGAQVISGIGFLGAGTILREGFSIKGLTTAASLWAVSCIGLAVGIGFWPGAFLGTLVIYFTLNALKKVAQRYSHIRTLYIGVDDEYHVSEKAAEVLRNCGAKLRTLEIIFPEENQPLLNKHTNKILKALCYIDNDRDMMLIKEGILALEGVKDFYVET